MILRKLSLRLNPEFPSVLGIIHAPLTMAIGMFCLRRISGVFILVLILGYVDVSGQNTEKTSTATTIKEDTINGEGKEVSKGDEDKEPSGKYRSADTVIITIDAKTNLVKFKDEQVVNQDGIIRIEVKNVNLFLYDVAINEKQNAAIANSVLSESPTSITSSFKRLDPSSLAIKDIFVKGQADAGNPARITEASNKLMELKFSLDQTIKDRDKALSVLNDTTFSPMDRKEAGDKLKVYLDGIRTLELTILTKENELNGLINKDTKTSEKIALYNARFTSYRDAVSQMINLVNIYNELILITSTPSVSYDDYKQGRDKILNAHFNNTDPILVMITINQQGKQVADAFNALMQAYNTFTKEEIESLKLESVYNYLVAYNEKLFSLEFNRVKESISSIINGIDETSYKCTYTTGIIKDDADIVSYQVVLTPKSNESLTITPKPITNTFEVRIKHGVKIDYSAGLFANFMLSDNSYSVLPYGDTDNNGISDSSIIRLDSKQDIFLPSVGAMIHLYRRTPRDLKWSMSTGVSISQNQAATYYFGGSAIFGRTQRIILSGGVAGKQVKTASDSYKPGTILPLNPDSVDSIDFLDNSPFRVGLFFGVTYNLASGTQPTGFTSFLTNQ